jgi:uncharacterized protein
MASGLRQGGLMLKYPMIWFVKGWRKLISPLYGDVCKYHPSCSAYGLRALETHGALKGGALTVARIVRCQPWSKGGVDYVPGTPERQAWEAQEASTDHEVIK